MSKSARILIVSEAVPDTVLINNLLREEFADIAVSTDPGLFCTDFEKYMPDVLVLAFNSIEKAERYYLGLYRHGPSIHARPHRTLLLCGKDDLKQAYQLCKKECFDDYVLFWPMTNDAQRLPMAVHQALRALKEGYLRQPFAEIAMQTRRVSELKGLLDRNLAHGSEQTEVLSGVVRNAEIGIGAAIDGFSRKLKGGELADALGPKNTATLQKEIRHLQVEHVQQHFRAVEEAVQPIRDWPSALKQAAAPQLEAARILQNMAEVVRSVVLIVDDDEFQRKLIANALGKSNYELIFAAGGVEALASVQKRRPDVILMDVWMPDLDGLEVTRRLKTAIQFASIPVIMMTGLSEKTVVIDSLKAGAVDFVVKPLVKEVLLLKLASVLSAP
ncbi:MAG: response regulator [Gammaproteobacteria bacterium]|nr:response regulator [Gammaproteobacteria bacterium]